MMGIMEYMIGMLLGGLAAGGVMAIYMQIVRPRIEQAIDDVIRDSVALGDVATALIRGSSVERCLVLCVTNGGGKPRLGASLYVTATINQVDEAHTGKWVEVLKMPLDIEYIRMLERLEVVGAQALRTDALQEGTLLRDMYDKVGIRYAEAHYLTSTGDAFFFASFATFTQDSLDDSRHDIRVAVNTFRQILDGVYRNKKARRRAGRSKL
jgi:hypothetical protein